MLTDFSFTLLGHTFAVSSTALLAVGNALLLVAAILLAFARRRRVTLQRSLVSDELMAHLSRIADALERQAARPVDQMIVEALKQADRSAQTAPKVEAHTIPYSMFGREFQQSR